MKYVICVIIVIFRTGRFELRSYICSNFSKGHKEPIVFQFHYISLQSNLMDIYYNILVLKHHVGMTFTLMMRLKIALHGSICPT